jgi:uncharacterized lipoprotein YmbA
MNSRQLLSLIALTLVLAGCVGSPTKPARFYLLSPDPGQPVAERASATTPLPIGLGPVTLPETYDRPQIVTRTNGNQINLAEFDRWGGDLNKELTRTLARNLMSRLNTDSVVLFPWPGRYRPDFQVSVRFFRLDGVLDSAATLDGVWRLLDGEKGCELAAHHFEYQVPIEEAGYAGLVDALNRGVARLSDEIARQVAGSKTGCD